MSDWIKVCDRLPSYGTSYLCAVWSDLDERYYQFTLFFMPNSGFDDTEIVDGVERITHWMPLPEPPNE